MRHRFLCLVAIVAVSANWPEYRGPSADGHAGADARPPVRWSESENIRWKTPIHGKGWSSPVLFGSQIWMTTATEDGKQLFAVCVDAETGKIIHDVKVFDIEKPFFCHPFNSYASPTPAVEAGRVYVHYGSAGTACLDSTTGAILWSRQDLPCNHHRAAGSSPIIHGDWLFIPFDGFDVQYVVALDKRTGRTVWKTDRNFHDASTDGDLKKGYGTPRVIDGPNGQELVIPSAGATAAYDPATGKELWRVVHGGMNAATRPVVGLGLVFVTTASGGKQLVAIRPGGRGDVTASHIAWTYARGVPTRSSPILVDDLLYFVHDGGVLTAVEAKTGKEIKKLRLGGSFTASPIYAGSLLYFFDQEGRSHVVVPGRDFTVKASNGLADGCMASPAAIGRALFVRTKSHLYRIEQAHP